MTGDRVASEGASSCQSGAFAASVQGPMLAARKMFPVVCTALALVLAAGLAPSPARAYRTFADDPVVAQPARWTNTSIAWDLDVSELSGDLSPADAEAAGTAAFGVIASAECGGFAFTALGPTTRAAAARDGRNTVSIVARDWALRGFAESEGAHTDVQLEVGADGHARVVEADIYLNFDLFTFRVSETGVGLDLVSVLLHEGLHGFGALLHPCEEGGEGGAPSCESMPDARSSALYPIYADGAGRVLGADDQAGLCALYGDCVPSCPTGSSCVEGACIPDPCVDPGCTACEDACGGDRCVDGACSSGICATVGAAAGFCVPVGSAGASCEGAADCMSGLCLTSARVGSYCTQRCALDAECGADQSCTAVGGMQVCAPRQASSGCTAARTSSSGAFHTSAAVALMLVLVARRRRS